MTMQHQEPSTTFRCRPSTDAFESLRHDASRAVSILRFAAPLLADPLSMGAAVSKASDAIRHARALLETGSENYEQMNDVAGSGALITAIGLLACVDYHAADYEMTGELDSASVKIVLEDAIMLIESWQARGRSLSTEIH